MAEIPRSKERVVNLMGARLGLRPDRRLRSNFRIVGRSTALTEKSANFHGIPGAESLDPCLALSYLPFDWTRRDVVRLEIYYLRRGLRIFLKDGDNDSNYRRDA